MRKIYLLFFFIFGSNVYAQNPDDIVYIPDANFKAKLLAGGISEVASAFTPIQVSYESWSLNSGFHTIDTNGDGEIQFSEAQVIKYLNINNSGISDITGIESFTNLELLLCQGNLLINLDLSQNISLKALYCGFQSLSEGLNVSQNTALKYLHCPWTEVNNLDVSQNLELEYLGCTLSGITGLDVTSNTNLRILYCTNDNLSSLDVTQNPLLQKLYCNGFVISSLNLTQNPILVDLRCEYIPITSIDLSQNPLLEYFYCYGNQLTSLDLSNNPLLKELYCPGNQITSLDLSQNPLLQKLDCNGNGLLTLSLKNGGQYPLSFLDFSFNDSIYYICADEVEINSIQNKINIYQYSDTCHVNSYCSFNPGGTFYSIYGATRFDNNSNGCSVNDLNIPNQRFIATNGTILSSFIANESGNFSIPVQSGSHTITPVLENPSYYNISPTLVTIDFPSETSPYNQDFCITANGIKNDLEIIIIPIEVARPGFDAHYKVIYKNKGNQVANGNLTFSFDDTIMDLISSIPSEDGSGTNSLNWNFTNLNPFETREINLTFNINSPMETPAVNGGDSLVYTATIVGATDETPTDNTFTLNQTVVNSYDPNDKTCLEGNTISPEMVGEYVHYVIRFENTGTFAAENVVIADVIDTTKFEINTLIPQSSSDDFFTRINGNKVEFIFENINLPFDDENNDGYVAFKIKTKPNLVLGDELTNTASIYFDYNFPIITNTTSTTVEEPLNNQDFDFETNFTLFPNPAKDVLNIKTKSEMDVKSVSIYNTLGQIIMTTIHAENGEINVSNLQSGSYFIKVFTDKDSSTAKFIKQ